MASEATVSESRTASLTGSRDVGLPPVRTVYRVSRSKRLPAYRRKAYPRRSLSYLDEQDLPLGIPTQIPAFVPRTGHVRVQARSGAGRQRRAEPIRESDPDEDDIEQQDHRNGGRGGPSGGGDDGPNNSKKAQRPKTTAAPVHGLMNEDMWNEAARHILAVIRDKSQSGYASVQDALENDVNAAIRGRFAIICAAERGAWDLVLQLLEGGVRPDILESTGRPLLY